MKLMTAYTIAFENVASTYSGKNHRCCCGCAGKHTYTTQHQEWSTKNRGYAVDEEDMSDRGVKIIINKMNKLIMEGYEVELNENYISVDADERLYVAYFVKTTEQTTLEK